MASSPLGENLAIQLCLKTPEHDWALIGSHYEGAKLALLGTAQQSASQVGDVDDDANEACVVYLARLLASREEGNGSECRRAWPLSRIVSVCSTNLYDLFRELPVVACKLAPWLDSLGPGARWPELEQANHVKEWQRTLLSLTLMSKKYKELLPRYVPNMGVRRPAVLRLGWLLFAVLKAKLLPSFPDLVSCINLLACVLNVMVVHTPETLLSQHQSSMQPPGSIPLDTLQMVCADLKTEAAQVAPQMAAVDSLLAHMLPVFVPEWRIQDGAPQSTSEQLRSRRSLYNGLVSDLERTTLVADGLEREYRVVNGKLGEIDELEFLFKDFSTMASPRFSPKSFVDAARKMRAVPSVPLAGRAPGPASKPLGPGAFIKAPSGLVPAPLGLQSPLPMGRLVAAGGPASTPLTETMAAATWLKSITSTTRAEPSPVLQQHLDAAGGAPVSAALSKRAMELVEAGLPDERPAGMPAASSLMGFPHVQSSLNALRRVDALKLYFTALEAILSGERAASEGALTVLIQATKFHKGLMACCLEVVIAAYKMASYTFPHVLDRLKLKAFDFSKVIQSFVQYLPSLPRELKRHLFVIEERIVESLAWEPGSPLYTLIISAAAGGAGPAAAPLALAAAVEPSSSGPASRALPTPDRTPPRPSVQQEVADMMQGVIAATVCDALCQDDRGAEAAASQPREAEEGAAPAARPPAHVSVPSPKRSHEAAASSSSVLCHGLASPSPLKKSRCDGSLLSAAVPRLLFSEPLPLAIGHSLVASTATSILEGFLSKVLKLMSFRLALLVDSFDFAPLDRHTVFSSVREVLDHALHLQTHLLYNRHADQLVLSALYGFCKVHKLDKVSFREIISQYKRQPQSTQTVFRSVHLEQSNPGLLPSAQGDIIAFYNTCFVPCMKPYLLKAAAGGEAAGTQHHLGLPPIAPPPLPRSAIQAGASTMAPRPRRASLPLFTPPPIPFGSSPSATSPARPPGELVGTAGIATFSSPSHLNPPQPVPAHPSAEEGSLQGTHVVGSAPAALGAALQDRPGALHTSGLGALLRAVDRAGVSGPSDGGQQAAGGPDSHSSKDSALCLVAMVGEGLPPAGAPKVRDFEVERAAREESFGVAGAAQGESFGAVCMEP